MRFKKVYIEITNRCNFACSFCCKSDRKKEYVSPERFSAILFSIKPYTNYIYLHVLGEPLLHPQLAELLRIADEMGFHVNLTTNGSLLAMRRSVLLESSIRQFNISLHDAEENVAESQWNHYLDEVFSFADERAQQSYFSLRLWNRMGDGCSSFNQFCLEKMANHWQVDMSDAMQSRNKKLTDHIFFQNAARFSWPGVKSLQVRNRTCYALKDHVAILVDGTVVPCCLDGNADLSLGNIFQQPFGEIISCERAEKMLAGFRLHTAVEPLCADCGFIVGG